MGQAIFKCMVFVILNCVLLQNYRWDMLLITAWCLLLLLIIFIKTLQMAHATIIHMVCVSVT